MQKSLFEKVTGQLTKTSIKQQIDQEIGQNTDEATITTGDTKEKAEIEHINRQSRR